MTLSERGWVCATRGVSLLLQLKNGFATCSASTPAHLNPDLAPPPHPSAPDLIPTTYDNKQIQGIDLSSMLDYIRSDLGKRSKPQLFSHILCTWIFWLIWGPGVVCKLCSKHLPRLGYWLHKETLVGEEIPNRETFFLENKFLATLGHLAKPSLTTEIYKEIVSLMWMV